MLSRERRIFASQQSELGLGSLDERRIAKSLARPGLVTGSRLVSSDFSRHLVAVGTIIADRPPHRSVRARLRIRLLPRMQSGEASHRIRMQNTGSRNPTAEERIESIPSYLSALTATHQHGAPQPADATAKAAQLSRITWDSMVLVVTQHNSAKPSTDLGRAMMLTALQLSLDGVELGRHSLLRRDPPDDLSFTGPGSLNRNCSVSSVAKSRHYDD